MRVFMYGNGFAGTPSRKSDSAVYSCPAGAAARHVYIHVREWFCKYPVTSWCWGQARSTVPLETGPEPVLIHVALSVTLVQLGQ